MISEPTAKHEHTLNISFNPSLNVNVEHNHIFDSLPKAKGIYAMVMACVCLWVYVRVCVCVRV